jgi:4a-hydroxytetrahydrobiopterin dehydratase
MSDLASKKCIPCESWVPPKTKEEAEKLLTEVKGWELVDGKLLKITRDFKFKDFKESLKFVNKVADLAEEEGHHPDIYIFYNKVTLALATHFIKGLSDNDFILAAKIDKLL